MIKEYEALGFHLFYVAEVIQSKVFVKIFTFYLISLTSFKELKARGDGIIPLNAFDVNLFLFLPK